MNCIPKNFVVSCDDCKAAYRMPFEIHTGILPVRVICPVCKGGYILDDIPPFPKQVSDTKLYATVKYGDDVFADIKPSEDDLIAEDDTLKREQKEKYRQKQEKKLTQIIASIQQKSIELQNSFALAQMQLSELASLLADDVNRHQLSLDNVMSIDINHVEHFLQHPYTALQLHCEDDQAARYARYVFAPRFCTAQLGYTVQQGMLNTITGSLQCKIVNAYYIAGRGGLDEQTRITLGIPRTPVIKLHGRKIYGEDVPYLYKQIPGVIPDMDHSATNISVIIDDYARFAVWCVQRGVNPWNPIPTDKRDVISRSVYDLNFNDEQQLECWKRFTQIGKLGLFSPNKSRLQSIAICIARMLKQNTIVFVRDEEVKSRWQSHISYPNEQSRGNVKYYMASDKVNKGNIELASVLMYDLTSLDRITLHRLKYLFDNPNKKSVIICHDPLLDFDTDNKIAPIVHAACGHEMLIDFHSEDNWDARRGETQQAKLWSGFARTLRQLQKNYKTKQQLNEEEVAKLMGEN